MSNVPYPHSRLGYKRSGLRFAPLISKVFSSVLLKILAGVRRMPHSTNKAHPPAVIAADTEVPDRVVKRLFGAGPKTLTPGVAKSGFI